MKLPSLSFLLQALFGAASRFPAASATALIGTFAGIQLIEEAHGTEPPSLRLFMVALLGLPTLIAVQAFFDSRRETPGARPLPAWLPWAAVAVVVALLGWYYVELDPHQPNFEYSGLPRYLALLIVAHLAVAAAPYLNRLPVEDFWEYNRQLFANIVVGAAYTVILYTGLALAILSVNELFDLSIDSDVYIQLFVVLAGIFNTALFLHRFPDQFVFEATDDTYNAVFKNLCQYILIPIVGLYFLILYAYSAKILLIWDLPHGWVSSLIIGFSTAGIFTYLLNYLLPRQPDAGAASRVFGRWFWPVVLPMTVLLFVAIGRRISDYGVTEERYFVAATGVWLFGMALYFIISRTDNIKFVPISLALVILLAFFGPYNAFQAARQSQLAQLEAVLTANGRWQNGVMRPGQTRLGGEEAQRIMSILDWFNRRNRLSLLEPHLPVSLDSVTGPTDRFQYWERSQKLADWLKIDPYGRPEPENRQVFLSSPIQEPVAVDIRGYTAFYYFTTDRRSADRPDSTGRFCQLSSDGRRLEWREEANGKDQLRESFDLAPVLRVLQDRGALDDWGRALLPAETHYDLRGRRADLRLVLREAQVTTEKPGPTFQSMTGYAFVREK